MASGRAVLIASLMICSAATAYTQTRKKPPSEVSVLCTAENAVDTTKQQILQSRTMDNPVQRIAVLLRGADLLWPHEQDKALAAFTEALDLAVQNFKENGDEIKRTSKSQFAAV